MSQSEFKINLQTIHQVVRKGNSYQVVTYSRGRLLDKGGFAEAYEIKDQPYALKVVSKSTLSRPKTMQKLRSEIAIHRELDHPNVVKFIKSFEDSSNVYLVLELCTNESLADLIKRRRTLEEPEAGFYLKQIIQAVDYLHNKNVVHRDLKLGNLFLS